MRQASQCLQTDTAKKVTDWHVLLLFLLVLIG
jgi:hypothetical protein